MNVAVEWENMKNKTNVFLPEELLLPLESPLEESDEDEEELEEDEELLESDPSLSIFPAPRRVMIIPVCELTPTAVTIIFPDPSIAYVPVRRSHY